MPRPSRKGLNWVYAVAAIGLFFAQGCSEPTIPKPHGYPRVDLPEHEYRVHTDSCGFAMEIPSYGSIKHVTNPWQTNDSNSSCWLNLELGRFQATVHCTYFALDNTDQLNTFFEESHSAVFSHDIKATSIATKSFEFPDRRVSGLMYELGGPVASPVHFFATDSVQNFMRGSLYFDHLPNPDSLEPSLNHVTQDIIHLIESLNWTSS